MISITIPSLYPEILVNCLENLDASTVGPFEAIVVSPHQPRVGQMERGTLVWIPEEEQRGVAAAHERAFEAATGEFVFAWADDHLIEGGWDNAALAEFLEAEAALFGMRGRARILSLGIRHTAPHNDVQTIFGRYYPCFPLMRRADVHAIGGWLSGRFRAGFSDSDLALRVWHAGGRCEWANLRAIRPNSDQRKVRPDHEAALNEDMALLLYRWPEMALGWDVSSASHFNIGVDPERLSRHGNTICCPEPFLFREIIGEASLQHV